MAETRRPLHLAVVFGLSATAYAISLAGVTALQSIQEASLTANVAPAADAIAQMKATNDRLTSQIANAGTAYNKAVTTYQKVAKSIVSLEGGVSRLAASVARIESTSLVVPSPGSVPVVARSTKPAGSSGASSGGGGGTAAVTAPVATRPPVAAPPRAPVVAPPPAPVVAPPPPKPIACTTASGKPC